MSHILIIGGSRGIGKVIAGAFVAAGDSVTALGSKTIDSIYPESLTHLILCQRYRGEGDAWLGELDTSLTLTHRLIEFYKDKFDGENNSIVIMSSIIAHSVADEQGVAYHMSKGALESMIAYYAVMLGKKIRVNGLSPAVTLKPENEQYYREHPEKVALFNRINPRGRMGTASDIANAVMFLCSPQADFINGHVLVVDGGVSKINPEALARSFLTKPAV